MRKSQQESSGIILEVRTRVEEFVLARQRQEEKCKKPSGAAKQDVPGCTSAGQGRAGGWSEMVTGTAVMQNSSLCPVAGSQSQWDQLDQQRSAEDAGTPVLHPGAPQPPASAEDGGAWGVWLVPEIAGGCSRA